MIQLELPLVDCPKGYVLVRCIDDCGGKFRREISIGRVYAAKPIKDGFEIARTNNGRKDLFYFSERFVLVP